MPHASARLSAQSPFPNRVFCLRRKLPQLRAAYTYPTLGIGGAQDPQLFGVSILENIAMGLPEYNEHMQRHPAHGDVATEVADKCKAAAAAANADAFIRDLPSGYRTVAGTSVTSSQLSGGQRQRVCIARAVVRDPRILLLDEATSALDTESERLVQESLDRLLADGSRTCTTIMIAHRLSTVTKADKIVVLEAGRVVDVGTHAELMSNEKGLYAAMRAMQELAHADGGERPGAPGTGGPASLQSSPAGPQVEGPATEKPAVKELELEQGPTEEKSKIDKEAEQLNSEELMMQEAQDLPPVPFRRIWAMHKGQELSFVIGSLGAFAGGCIQPIFSVIYADIIVGFFEPDADKLRATSKNFLGYFFCLGCAALVAVTMRVSIFTSIGERLTRKVRVAKKPCKIAL